MEKPFLSGTLKLDEAALKSVFIYNLNQIHPVLLHLTDCLPKLALATCYGDLQNIIEEFLAEVKIQMDRVEEIFIQLKEVPAKEDNYIANNILPILAADDPKELQDDLLKDLALVFYLQRVIAIKCNYFHILKSIANSLNNILIKQYLQYSFDECKDNQLLFRLVSKEYMESRINIFLQ